MEIKRNILLNPGPATTTDTVKMAQVIPDICPREKEFRSIMDQMREELVSVVHGDRGYTAVLFCGSGTICMDVVLNSLLDEGKKALVVNNGFYSQRAVDVLTYYGLPCINLSQPFDTFPDLSTIEKTLQDHSDIGYIYITHHETGSGLLNPIRQIGALAHKYGAFFIVDTTSSYAMIPIYVYEDHVDICMASAQKGLMGMAGLSYVIGKKSIIEESRNYPKRSYYCNLYMQYEHFERTGEMHFTPPVQTVYAARQALDEYFSEGEKRKWERHQRVMCAIHEGEEKLGLKEVLERRVQSGLVSTVKYPDDPNWDFDAIHDFCYERGFTIYPGKLEKQRTFRLCALGAIDRQDIEAFWDIFKSALKACHVQTPVFYSGAKTWVR